MRFGPFLLAAWLMLCTPFAAAGPRYTVMQIAGPGSWASAINSSGQLTGTLVADGNAHAFYYDGASLHDIGTLGGASSTGQAINDSGTVAGISEVDNGASGFVYSGGTLTALPAGLVFAYGINNANTVTGLAIFSTPAGVESPRAYTYDSGAGGSGTNLGILPGYDFPNPGTYGLDINAAGHVVGQAITGTIADFPDKSFLYRDGVMQELGDFGDRYGQASAINDHDQITGGATTRTADNTRAFLWEDGVVRYLGALTPNGASFAYDINNTGQIVGDAATAKGSGAFLYDGAAMLALDSLIDPAAGWSIAVAYGINDFQQIAAQACRLDGCYAVRLDPIPEPATAWMLAAGILIPVLRYARQRDPVGLVPA